MRILVVDDDPDFLDLLHTEMAHIEHVHLEVANDPERALRMLAERNYDLVVSDWQLDRTTGPEVMSRADHLRHRRALDQTAHAKTPVIFMSGSDKTAQTRALDRLHDFQPVSFMLKSCGPPLIRVLAENILLRFGSPPSFAS